jgi:glucose-1-phosphate cytidylyltransferase
MAHKYEGFWRAMDTLKDRQVLEEMVERGEASADSHTAP